MGNQEGGMGWEEKGLNQIKGMMHTARETDCGFSICLEDIPNHENDVIKILYHYIQHMYELTNQLLTFKRMSSQVFQ